MRLFRCNHKWVVTERSNILQQDNIGYPLRLCICRCKKCGIYDQQWIDVPENDLNELKTGKSVLIKWQ